MADILKLDNAYMDAEGIIYGNTILKTYLDNLFSKLSDGVILKQITNIDQVHENQPSGSIAFCCFQQHATGTPDTTANGLLISYKDGPGWGTQFAMYNGQVRIRSISNGTWGTWHTA